MIISGGGNGISGIGFSVIGSLGDPSSGYYNLSGLNTRSYKVDNDIFTLNTSDYSITAKKSGKVRLTIGIGNHSTSKNMTFTFRGYINGNVSSAMSYTKTLASYTSYIADDIVFDVNKNDVIKLQVSYNVYNTNMISVSFSA